MAQMVVEHHGDVADQETALRRNGQAVRFEADQTEGFQLLHILQFDREITAKRNAEHAFVNPIIERQMCIRDRPWKLRCRKPSLRAMESSSSGLAKWSMPMKT